MLLLLGPVGFGKSGCADGDLTADLLLDFFEARDVVKSLFFAGVLCPLLMVRPVLFDVLELETR